MTGSVSRIPYIIIAQEVKKKYPSAALADSLNLLSSVHPHLSFLPFGVPADTVIHTVISAGYMGHISRPFVCRLKVYDLFVAAGEE